VNGGVRNSTDCTNDKFLMGFPDISNVMFDSFVFVVVLDQCKDIFDWIKYWRVRYVENDFQVKLSQLSLCIV